MPKPAAAQCATVTTNMDAPELQDSVTPETAIDFARLREIRDELKRLSHFWQDVGYSANDMSLGFIPLLTLNVMTGLQGNSNAPLTSLLPLQSVALAVLQVWAHLFPHTARTMVILVSIAFGFPVALLMIKYGVLIAMGKRMEFQVKPQLERCQVLSQFLDGWSALPDITAYNKLAFNTLLNWPIPAKVKKGSVRWQVQTFVSNLNWFIRPPRRFMPWRSINVLVRGASAVLCLLLQLGVLATGSGFNQQVTPAWSAYLLAMLGTWAVFITTCIMSAVVPEIPFTSKARMLLAKLKPVFEILGPEPGARKAPLNGAAT
jgi:hypothetical protein